MISDPDIWCIGKTPIFDAHDEPQLCRASFEPQLCRASFEPLYPVSNFKLDAVRLLLGSPDSVEGRLKNVQISLENGVQTHANPKPYCGYHRLRTLFQKDGRCRI